jgi:hypothetical protein
MTFKRKRSEQWLYFNRLCCKIYINMFRVKQILAALLLCVLSVLGNTPTVHAAQANSTNYGVSEVNFGSGGELHACSTTYCAKQSAGELVVGNTSSTNYQAQGGFNTNREELLEVSVSGTAIALGGLDPTAVKYGTSSFSVRTYLASGYAVIIDGSSPRTIAGAGHVLAPMSSADISRPGTEQFGINLVANTTPGVGSNPQQIPDSTFSFGAAASGYNTANNFKYVAGNTIASSSKSSGLTTYTMSVIENISTNTPPGIYNGSLVVIATPTF